MRLKLKITGLPSVSLPLAVAKTETAVEIIGINGVSDVSTTPTVAVAPT